SSEKDSGELLCYKTEGGTVALISLCKYEPADLGVWRGLIALSVDSVEQRIVGQKLRPLGSCQSAEHEPVPMHREHYVAQNTVKSLSTVSKKPCEITRHQIQRLTAPERGLLPDEAEHWESPVV
ncbi:hypothetical protein KUCAC02_017701, partial [Chaenocephalus aceratus]